MKNIVYINDAKVDISDGDFIDRVLPNGNVERHIILDTGFKSGTGCDQDHFECRVRKLTAELPIKKSETIYHINGDNSRVYNNSLDFSNNTVKLSGDIKFEELKAIFSGRNNESVILKHISELEELKDSNDYNQKYKDFIDLCRDYMYEISPFIPSLTKFLKVI
ncbi:hypothetical protein [Pedobacter hiemivivus]|uniref:Uncharacterized protein n=1 Tax=Pedobacter hiemivivus TaxID=2530454 RepID=A0A4R0NIW6_9SPHI|nr:hypothetical protein [Pedobacter hiemivivus]TCC98804.1 hypothetical protein EZ444_05885 [Pedobacter hiemivivus]